MLIRVLIGPAFVAALLAPWSARAAPEAPFAPASPPVRVEYRKPKNPAHEALYAELRTRQVLARFEEVFSAFRLPRTLTLAFAGCDGTSNAWYEPADATVTVCYEYLVEMRALAASKPRGKVPLQDASDGPALFVMLHESGHAIFDLLKVPILGREEDAADSFAVFMLLRAGQEVAFRTLRGAAWSFRAQAKSRKPDEGDFADIHGLDSQRFYNIICLAYGSDPKYFAAAVTEKLLPADRAEGCGDEYHQLLFAFQKLILPSLDTEAIQRVLIKHKSDWKLGDRPSGK